MEDTHTMHRNAYLTRSTRVILAVSVANLLLILFSSTARSDVFSSVPGHRSAPSAFGPADPEDAISSLLRQAKRLKKRLAAGGLGTPPAPILARAFGERRALSHLELTITLEADPPITTVLRLAAHPDWIRLRATSLSADVDISADAIQVAIDRGDVPELPLMRSSVVTSVVRDEKNVLRAVSSGPAKPGLVLENGAADAIAEALRSGAPTLTLRTMRAAPTVTIPTARGDRTLALLATGLSDFAHSSPNRVHNVLKAINDRVHNVILEPDEAFSLVAALDAPITLAKGWKEEQGLFGGGSALTPGAGICQAATTIYRTALLAGLPVSSKRNHSLFVDHYEFFGVGLDATVFPRVQDLQFQNDTGGMLMLQAYTEGDTVFVSLYGESDGRIVTLEGPYFASSKKRNATLRPLQNTQIGWVRTVEYSDGKIKTEPLVSTYAKPVWGYVARKYGALEGMKLLVQRENTPGIVEKPAPAELLVRASLLGEDIGGAGGRW